jgi:hypothetical protein
LPQHLLRHELGKNKRKDGVPDEGDAFHDPISVHRWAEFRKASNAEIRNPLQNKVNLFRSEKVWYYLPRGSTDAKPQYTHDPNTTIHNPKSNFLDTVRPAATPFISRYSTGNSLGKLPLPTTGNHSRTLYQGRSSYPGNTSIPLGVYHSPHLPRQQQYNPTISPRAMYGASQPTYGPTSGARTASYGQHPMPGYQPTFQQPMDMPRLNTSAATASPQDLMRSPSASGKAPNPIVHAPMQFYKRHNSPAIQVSYSDAENKYISRPYFSHRMNSTEPAAPAFRALSQSLPRNILHHSRDISREHEVILQSLQQVGLSKAGALAKSNELDHMPFNPPSRRVEIREAVLETAIAKGKGHQRSFSKPEAVNGYMEQVTRARAASNKFNNAERLLATVGKALPKELRGDMMGAAGEEDDLTLATENMIDPSLLSVGGDTQSGATAARATSSNNGNLDASSTGGLDVMSTSALFSSLINTSHSTPEPPNQANDLISRITPPPRMTVENREQYGFGTPERPDFSPLSDIHRF